MAGPLGYRAILIGQGAAQDPKTIAAGTTGTVLATVTTGDEPTWTASPSLTGGALVITPATGNLAIQIRPGGTNAGDTGEIRMRELVANGTSSVGLKAADSLAANWSLTLPDAAPTVAGSALVATTGGVASWRPFVGARNVLTYAATIAVDASLGTWHVVTVTDANAHAFGAPTNPTTGQAIMLTLRNTFGVIATATFNAAFKQAGYVAPANGFSASARFEYDGSNWIQTTLWTAVIPN